MIKKSIKVLDLFSGCGGMSLGFQNAGFEICQAYDSWKPAVDVYRLNFNHPIEQKDLSDFSVVDEMKAIDSDIIIGGPPCQDFSIAGGRNENGNRANLTLSFASLVCEIRPKWFVMENVYNIEKFAILNQILGLFENAGYGLSKGVFDASYMGVPQSRKRFFLIGKLGESKDFLVEKIKSKLSPTRMSIKDYLGDSLMTDFYYMHPRSYNRRAVFSIEEPSSTIRGVNRPIPLNYQIHPADKIDDLSQVRALTYKERSYIQTFPESFKFTGTKSAIEQMIGNAVPVKMAEFFGKIIYENF